MATDGMTRPADRVTEWEPPAPASWFGLRAAARADRIRLFDDVLARLARYRDLLVEWNRRFNLTAVTDPIGIERRLFLDSLRLLPEIDGLAGDGAPNGRPRLVDIGSGAGFPGLPIAICRPALEVVLIEATGKKVGFLDAVIADLDLPNTRAVHARAEEIGREPAHRGAYDLATARAVAALPALVELALPLLRVGGHALFPKGLDLDGELAGGHGAAAIVGGEIVGDSLLPGGETRLIVVRKTVPTPARFPRRPGIPAKEPLARPPVVAGRHGGMP